MILTSGRGPLSANPAGRFVPPIPHGVAYVEPFRRRVWGMVGGRTVIDSEAVLPTGPVSHRPTRSRRTH